METETWATSRDAVPAGFTQITVYDNDTGKRVATVFDENAVKLVAAAPLLPVMVEALRDLLQAVTAGQGHLDHDPRIIASRAALRQWEAL